MLLKPAPDAVGLQAARPEIPIGEPTLRMRMNFVDESKKADGDESADGDSSDEATSDPAEDSGGGEEKA